MFNALGVNVDNTTKSSIRYCSSCRGSGQIQSVGSYPCRFCNGSGRISHSRICNKCSGMGKLTEMRTERCKSCGGRGKF